jgi:hypothetical protein
MFTGKIHRYLFLFGVFGLAFGMMIGTVPTSVPQIILMANWLLEGQFKEKWLRIRFNKVYLALASLFIIHVIGLLYTSDLQSGWNDVRTKLPLFFFPLILFTSAPLTATEMRRLFYCFIAGSVANTLWCLVYSFILHQHQQVRNASRFMSHIRLGLYLNMAIACCAYFFLHSTSAKGKIIFTVLALYFVVVLFVLGLASGLANFFILLLIGFGYLIYRQPFKYKIAAGIVFGLVLFTVFKYVIAISDEQLKVKPGAHNVPQLRSFSGAPYIHFDSTGQKENGNYVLINIQLQELQKAWNSEFKNDTFSYDPGHNLSRFEVLVRYMASKGLTKDSAGYSRLSQADKQNISRNMTNFRQPSWSFLRKRTYELVNEFDEFRHGRNVNGHSLSMRIHFWNAAWHLVQRKPLVGVGTGDVQNELNAAYEEINSPLEKEWHKRPHNQFITITVALGIIGLGIFLVSLIYPVAALYKWLSVLYWPFILLAVISFLLEDTLETQAGLTFFAFFNTVFLVDAHHKKELTGRDD